MHTEMLKKRIEEPNLQVVVKPADQIASMICVYKNIQNSDNPKDIMQAIQLAESMIEHVKSLHEEACAYRRLHLKELGVEIQE